ncbi:MAG TPA: hypothetical protein VGQ11_07920 [Candidatus Acidoferrales bacterium]|jgi:hypothetical protein|nr:hypothetical protein [Candidatus Acidoferrales bacterium]
MNPQEQVTSAVRMFSARIFLVASSLFFAAAICVHHNFHLASMLRDVAIYPAVLFVPAALWKNRRWLYVAAAIVIALPSFAFLDNPSALTRPAEVKSFLNQLFLLLGGASAILAGVTAFVRKRA